MFLSVGDDYSVPAATSQHVETGEVRVRGVPGYIIEKLLGHNMHLWPSNFSMMIVIVIIIFIIITITITAIITITTIITIIITIIIINNVSNILS